MVKPGYKQTEIGVIPEDWSCVPAKYLMKIETGSRNTEHKTDEGKYPFFVRSQRIEHIDTYHYDCEAVLTAGDGVGTGKVFHHYVGKFDAHQRVYVMSNFNGVSGRYFYNYFSENFGFEVSKYTAKSSVDSVRRDMIAEMIIPLPLLPEQKRIAEALSDVDSMISSLEKLIAKKKAVKQGAMQELLTGKKRLPGFTGEWVKKSDIFLFAKGIQMNSALQNESGKYPVYNGGREPSGYIDQYNCGATIIISEGGNSCGYVNRVEKNFWAGGHCYYICDSQLNMDFLYQLLKLYENDIMGLRVGSGLPNIQKESLRKLKFLYPIEMDEQTAIASILSDMDNEIESLEQKLAKTRQLKQGMMQQLLTGKIRLM